jgi:hypothetical protein
MKGEDSVNELNIGLAGKGRQHVPITMLEVMSELIERPERKPAPSKRKSAFPEKKAKRKMMQASRKKNR